jgi:SAM-dependent methyltransferase
VVSVLPPGLESDPRRDTGLYGKDYWLGHQRDRGLPDVTERVRTDPSERCVFWLERLLEHARPPGRALEIGCGHGAFVSLLREVGFDAIGMELSPWVVEFARTTFGVPVRQGTLETVDLEPGLSCIAAFDVLEHLADPLAMVSRCARLLAPDGVLLLQTPRYRGEGPDWAMFQPDEHIYLFSDASARDLLVRAGFHDVEIRPSLFPYDMWIAASPTRLARGEGTSARGRMPLSVRALLDLGARARALQHSLIEANADRTERLHQVEELTEVARRAEAERLRQVGALTAQIGELTAIAREAETHRLTQAEDLTAQIEELTAIVRKVEAARVADVAELTRLLHESEADRAARLHIIRSAEAEMQMLGARIEDLERQLRRSGSTRRTGQ